MESCEQITQIIYGAIDEVNRTMTPERALQKSLDTVIIGKSGRLDSLEFVNFIVALEENINSLVGKQVSVFDIMTVDGDSLWTVAALVRCIARLLNGAGAINNMPER